MAVLPVITVLGSFLVFRNFLLFSLNEVFSSLVKTYILTLGEVLSNLVIRCYLSKNFRGLVHCLVIMVQRCFLICFISDNFYSLSLFPKLVNNFFYFFKSFFAGCFLNVLGTFTGNPCRFKVSCRFSSAAYTNISYRNICVNNFFKKIQDNECQVKFRETPLTLSS